MAGDMWAHKPSPIATMIFLVLFAITTVWHVTIIIRRRTRYFIALVIGGVLEVAGYVCRFLATRDTENMTFFIVQTLCILVAPALFAASIYMVLGRLILLVRGEHLSPIRPSRLTLIFVGGDIVSFIVQLMGSGLLSKNFSLGKTIILVGLAAQLIFFGVFITVAGVFHRRLVQSPTQRSEELDLRSRTQGWRDVVLVIYISGALIFVRSVFRLVEFTGDHDSPMQTSEAFLYVCDSTLMFGVLAVLIYRHPGEYVPSRKEIGSMRIDEEMT